MKTKIGALALVALMLTMAVPVAGQGDWQELRERWLNRREKFQQAYSDWMSAVTAFQQAREAWTEKRTSANLANLVEQAKNAGLKGSGMIVAYLELLRARAEATRGLSENEKASLLAELDDYISTMEGRINAIQAAENGQAVREAARELWQCWLQIRVRVKQITAQLMVAAAEAALWRAQAFAARVEARIGDLKENGVDTSALETWLTDFNSKLELAQQRIENAKVKVGEITDNVTFQQIFWTAAAHLRAAVSYLKDTLRDLRNIIVDMRSKAHTVTIAGSGTLIGEGDGSAFISGTGLVKVATIKNGVLIVSANAHVKTDGKGTRETLENKDVKYQGMGWARITGTDITISTSGEDIKLYAHGRGTATLTGAGWYRTFGENKYVDGTWSSVGVTATLETGEVQG